MDLSTTYMGMKLRSPVVPSASPLSERIEDLERMEQAGAGAVVLYSIFEEQLTMEPAQLRTFLAAGQGLAASASLCREEGRFQTGPDGYLEHIAAAKKALSIPIIASLNVRRSEGWTSYAKRVEEAGADAVELNIYDVPTDPSLSGSAIEARVRDIVRAARQAVHIPVAVKLSPYFTNMTNVARQVEEAGASALVLFNRFYQSDIDLSTRRVHPSLSLSRSEALRLPLRWIAILYGRVGVDLAATSGVHRAEDALKMLLVGAKVTMVASLLLRLGIDQIRVLESEMRIWLEAHEYGSIRELQGSMSQKNYADPSAFERAQYIQVLESREPVFEHAGEQIWSSARASRAADRK